MNPYLWDKEHVDYADKKKKNAWRAVMEVMWGEEEVESWDVKKKNLQGLKDAAPETGVTKKSGETATRATFFMKDDLETCISLESPITVDEAKNLIASQRGVDPVNVTVSCCGIKIGRLDCLGGGDFGVDITEDVPSTNKVYEKPKRETVNVIIQKEDGSTMSIPVVVVDCRAWKQYLGGYKDKRTGCIYYHGTTQTNPRYSNTLKFTRETQTYLTTKEEGMNTARSQTTQTFIPGRYWPTQDDKIITPQPYTTCDSQWKTMISVKAATIIQRAWRQYRTKSFFRKTIIQAARDLSAVKHLEQLSTLDMQNTLISLLIKESHPVNPGDFSSLSWVINNWAVKEGRRLLAMKTDMNKKVALMNVLRDEVKMLLDLEKQRIKSTMENDLKAEIEFLEGTALSRVRQYPGGNVTVVDDVNIQTAKMYKEMFASYKRTDTTPTERLDILSAFRTCLHLNFEPELPILELIELIDRETDMIVMGIADKHLVYLRKRFETGFLNVMHNPEINPQAKYFKKFVAPAKKYALYRCNSCKKILSPHSLFYDLRISKFSLCKSCFNLRQNATGSNLALYASILEKLRDSERKKDCKSAISNLLQPYGTYFLVHVIWNGRCIVTESDFLPTLRLTRWLPDQDWSMWNTILLTEHEAAKHEKISNPLQHYDEEFILKVRIRNLVGKFHFGSVINIDKRFKTDPTNLGRLPPDFLLYVDRTHERYAPCSSQPEFLRASNTKIST